MLENWRPFWEGNKCFVLFFSVLFHSQSLEGKRWLHHHNLTVPSYRVDGLEPFALFDFTVTPYTYWGKASTTSVFLRAPEGGTKILNPCNRYWNQVCVSKWNPGEKWEGSGLVSWRQSCKDMFLSIFGNYLLHTEVPAAAAIKFGTESTWQYAPCAYDSEQEREIEIHYHDHQRLHVIY